MGTFNMMSFYGDSYMTGGLGGMAGNKKCNRNCISSLTASPPCPSRHSQKVQPISFILFTPDQSWEANNKIEVLHNV